MYVYLYDSLLGHPFYVSAACGIVEAYMRIADNAQQVCIEIHRIDREIHR